MRNSRLLQLAILFLVSGLIAGCASTPTSITPTPSVLAPYKQMPAPSTTASQNSVTDQVTSIPTIPPVTTTTATSQPTSIPIPVQPTPDRPLAGGTVTNGPFAFTLFLYRDEALRPSTAVEPWNYSDLSGVGAYMDWVYHGPLLQGPVDWVCGNEQDLSASCGGWYDHLQDGYHGGRAGGGILLAGGPYLSGSSHTGDVVRWAVKVRTPQGTYGAALRFVLQQGPNGFEPTDITVEVLPAG